MRMTRINPNQMVPANRRPDNGDHRQRGTRVLRCWRSSPSHAQHRRNSPLLTMRVAQPGQKLWSSNELQGAC